MLAQIGFLCLQFEPQHEISNNVVCATNKASDQPAHTHSLISFEYSLSVKLLTKHHLEFLSLNGGCTGLFESIHVKLPHCWKSHASAHLVLSCKQYNSWRNVTFENNSSVCRPYITVLNLKWIVLFLNQYILLWAFKRASFFPAVLSTQTLR